MKKLSNVLLTVFVLANFNLMAQKNAWHLFKPTGGNYPNIQFSGTGYAPSLLTTGMPESFKIPPSTPFTDYVATNVITDNEGKLLFSVISTLTDVFLYDINNQMVGGQSLRDNNLNPVQGSKEITIVPVDKGVKYHIITSKNIWEYDLATFTVTNIENLSGAKITSGTTNIVHDFNVAVKLNYIDNNTEGCLAGYTCYWLVANPVGLTERKIYKKDYNIATRSFSASVTFDILSVNSIATNFLEHLSELEVSPDGSKLAFADNHRVLVFNLNTNGTVASYNSSYNYDAPTGTTLKVAGIEFTSGSDKLAFSTFDPSGSATYNAVYLWDFTNNTSPSAFSLSSDFGRSAIEMGKDANMYVARSDGLHKLNLSGLTISSVINGIIIYKTSNIFKLHDPNTTRDCGIYNLPDQIDGKVIEYFNLSQTAYTVKSGKLNWNKTVNVPIGGANWTNTSHALTTKGSVKYMCLEY